MYVVESPSELKISRGSLEGSWNRRGYSFQCSFSGQHREWEIPTHVALLAGEPPGGAAAALNPVEIGIHQVQTGLPCAIHCLMASRSSFVG